jgi:hypothetical protein
MSSVTVSATSGNANPAATSTHALYGNYNLAVGYLRAFITLLHFPRAALRLPLFFCPKFIRVNPWLPLPYLSPCPLCLRGESRLSR